MVMSIAETVKDFGARTGRHLPPLLAALGQILIETGATIGVSRVHQATLVV